VGSTLSSPTNRRALLLVNRDHVDDANTEGGDWMISDTLADAVVEIDQYLADFPVTYEGDLRERLLTLRNQMDSLRKELDAPPSTDDREGLGTE
jgi:hypothetical protein